MRRVIAFAIAAAMIIIMLAGFRKVAELGEIPDTSLVPAELQPYVTRDFTKACFSNQYCSSVPIGEDMPGVATIRELVKKFVSSYANRDYRSLTGIYASEKLVKAEFISSLVSFKTGMLIFDSPDHCTTYVDIYYKVNHLNCEYEGKIKQNQVYRERLYLNFYKADEWVINNNVIYGWQVME